MVKVAPNSNLVGQLSEINLHSKIKENLVKLLYDDKILTIITHFKHVRSNFSYAKTYQP